MIAPPAAPTMQPAPGTMTKANRFFRPCLAMATFPTSCFPLSLPLPQIQPMRSGDRIALNDRSAAMSCRSAAVLGRSGLKCSVLIEFAKDSESVPGSFFLVPHLGNRLSRCSLGGLLLCLLLASPLFAGPLLPPVQFGKVIKITNVNVRIDYDLNTVRANFYWKNTLNLSGVYAGL